MTRPITLFTGQWADLPLDDLAAEVRVVGLRRPGAGLLGRPLRGRPRAAPTPGYAQRPARAARAPRPDVLGARQPPRRPGGLRPDRRAATRAILPPDVWGDGDPEGVRRRAAERMKDTARAAAAARRRGRQRLHRLADLAPALLVPAQRLRGDRARLRGLRRALEPDHRRLRRRGRAVRPRGPPDRDRLRLRHDAQGARRRSADRAGFGINFDPSHLVHQFLDPARVHRSSSPTASTTSTSRTRKRRLDGRRSILGSHLELRRARRAAGTSSRPATATSTSRRCSARSTASATRGPLSIEWEDSGMDREWGAPDALAFVRRTDFAPSHGRLRRRVREDDRDAEIGFVTMATRRGDGDVADDRRRDARLRLHGQGAHQRATRARLHDLAAAARAAPGGDRRAQRGGGAEAARRYGYERASPTGARWWPTPRVQLFDNVGPNNLHAEPTIAAAEAGKHVICEKPLGRDAAEARRDLAARRRPPASSTCAPSTTASCPAIRLARELIQAGELGEIHHFRGRYLQDWIADPTRRCAGGSTSRRAGLRRAGRPRRAHHRPGPLPRRRDRDGDGADRTFVPAPGRGQRRRRLRGRRRVRERRGRHARGLALRRRAQERAHAGRSTARKGSIALQPRALQRAAGHSRTTPGARPRASAPCSSPSATTPSGRTGGRRATSSAGSTPSSTSSHHLLTAILDDNDVAPHGATFEDGYRAAEVCDAIRAPRPRAHARRCATADVSNERS